MRNIAKVARGPAEWAGTGHAVCLRGKASVFPLPIASRSQRGQSPTASALGHQDEV